MTRTHHATRAFRLSCGCIRDYPGMPSGQVHEVMCPVCWVAAETVYDYPDRTCGVRSGQNQCTEPIGNDICAEGVHLDSFTNTGFRLMPKLRKSDEGTTSKA